MGCRTARIAEVPSVPQHSWSLVLLQEADLGWSSGVQYHATASPACVVVAASPISRLGKGFVHKLSSLLFSRLLCWAVTKEARRSTGQGNTLLYIHQPNIRNPSGVQSWELPSMASSSGAAEPTECSSDTTMLCMSPGVGFEITTSQLSGAGCSCTHSGGSTGAINASLPAAGKSKWFQCVSVSVCHTWKLWTSGGSQVLAVPVTGQTLSTG